MIDSNTFLEETWAALLSRDKAEVLCAFNSLDAKSRKVVLEHLKKMSTEDGWHPQQIESARCALAAIMDEEPR